jgi:hypothetical protein
MIFSAIARAQASMGPDVTLIMMIVLMSLVYTEAFAQTRAQTH